ncbi:conserved protein of unknown function [Pseudodesulfovibrio profundus]|uniref:Uncharacterized protein n=1 Tax=Pseudodesulfovibrio profundus TaxID=57320 RepID=A0A2C8FDE3_9BACT|nr:hypothetical protein [Pseudodesulfovibrio profundus]SOB60517.1 conserved protein of unknown function [Pseudodesulfovibrio profundus]
MAPTPDTPSELTGIINAFQKERNIALNIREFFWEGKSGAYVGLVDCDGDRNGLYVLKVDNIPHGYEGEEALHRQAQDEGAFGGNIPELVETYEFEDQYLLLMQLAGRSRIQWRPLVTSMTLFKSAYIKLGDILWSDSSVSHHALADYPKLLKQALDYRLEATKGRIRSNMEEQFGLSIVDSNQFIHCDEVLPNPYTYALSSENETPMIRPLMGPTHGDCHASNIFVRAGQGADVLGIYLIDLAFYKPSALFFFDHAYFELATLLNELNGLGEVRWFQLTKQLASCGEIDFNGLAPDERGWADAVIGGRLPSISIVEKTFPDRTDDIWLQFLIAQVAAGLSFVNKPLCKDGTSNGISPSQYRQAFVWASIFLNEALKVTDTVVCASDNGMVPLLEKQEETKCDKIPSLGLDNFVCESISDGLWDDIGGFDPKGLNILILSPSARELPLVEIEQLLALEWAVILDFATTPIPDYNKWSKRPFRQAWPGNIPQETKILSKGALWIFANGRIDLSDAPPAESVAEWRRNYIRDLNSFFESVAQQIAPSNVRVLVCGDESSTTFTRFVTESIDTYFHTSLAPVLINGVQSDNLPDSVDCVPIKLDDFFCRIEAYGDPETLAANKQPLLPCRIDRSVKLHPLKKGLFDRAQKDLTFVHRRLCDEFPSGREFGVDFRRGLPIEWAELAQQIDIERELTPRITKQIQAALSESSNRTINLLHEPSAGGSTLSRRIAWELMEENPVVFIDQITEDTAGYLREIFQFTSLPLLVVIEASIVKESSRESLLQQLWEDNTRAVFLWVARTYEEQAKSKDVLTCLLSKTETQDFLEAYLEQVSETSRIKNIRELARRSELVDQRTPFFFGLNAFEEEYYGLEQLVASTINNLSLSGKDLLADLCLASAFSSEGLPLQEFKLLCEKDNEGEYPFSDNSPFAIEYDTGIRVSHRLIALKTLKALARNKDTWKADIVGWALHLLKSIEHLHSKDSERVKKFIETLFLTRDTAIVLEADTDYQAGRFASKRFSPLILHIGNSEQSRSLLKELTRIWPFENHYAVHYARHLLYESPKEIEAAITVAERAENSEEGEFDDVVIHTVGMCYRGQIEAHFEEAKELGTPYEDIASTVRQDFEISKEKFVKATELNPRSEYGHVATIQSVSILVNRIKTLTKKDTLESLLASPDLRWLADAMQIAEESIAVLRSWQRHKSSTRVDRTIAEWDLVYGNVDAVIGQLRVLVNRGGDNELRRALCSAMLRKRKRQWERLPQADLRSIVNMMDQNIHMKGVRDSDIRSWLFAYRHLETFDIQVAVQRLLDWRSLRPKEVLPVFYLSVMNFLRWLSNKNIGYADEINKWLDHCRQNRQLGQKKQWGHEWLVKGKNGPRAMHFSELTFDPSKVIRGNEPGRDKKLKTFHRVSGVLVKYSGPQNATVDLGNRILAPIVPLQTIVKDDLGKRVSLIVAFTYDGLRGWDPMLDEE